MATDRTRRDWFLPEENTLSGGKLVTLFFHCLPNRHCHHTLFSCYNNKGFIFWSNASSIFVTAMRGFRALWSIISMQCNVASHQESGRQSTHCVAIVPSVWQTWSCNLGLNMAWPPWCQDSRPLPSVSMFSTDYLHKWKLQPECHAHLGHGTTWCTNGRLRGGEPGYELHPPGLFQHHSPVVWDFASCGLWYLRSINGEHATVT